MVSGGHTNIYHVKGPGAFTLMGQTRDDAAGEAFDKVAKMMGLSYPGGPAIEALAKKGDPEKIKFPRSMLGKDNFDFSFSGLKSAVARHLHENPDMNEGRPAHVAAGFQMAVIDVLSTKLIAAAREKTVPTSALQAGSRPTALLLTSFLKGLSGIKSTYFHLLYPCAEIMRP